MHISAFLNWVTLWNYYFMSILLKSEQIVLEYLHFLSYCLDQILRPVKKQGIKFKIINYNKKLTVLIISLCHRGTSVFTNLLYFTTINKSYDYTELFSFEINKQHIITIF